MQNDIYQERYLEHQKRKKEMKLSDLVGTKNPKLARDLFFKILRDRRSQRIFNDEEITDWEIEKIFEAVRVAPSSCNRQAIKIKVVREDELKAKLENLLVGGFGWIGKAKIILLIFADMDAYKSPNEIDFMPYLDAGFVGENIYLACEAMNIGTCFVNPNIRQEKQEEFKGLFLKDNLKFCGAMAVGHYDRKMAKPPLREIEDIYA